jgi:hypothetical protein
MQALLASVRKPGCPCHGRASGVATHADGPDGPPTTTRRAVPCDRRVTAALSRRRSRRTRAASSARRNGDGRSSSGPTPARPAMCTWLPSWARTGQPSRRPTSASPGQPAPHTAHTVPPPYRANTPPPPLHKLPGAGTVCAVEKSAPYSCGSRRRQWPVSWTGPARGRGGGSGGARRRWTLLICQPLRVRLGPS